MDNLTEELNENLAQLQNVNAFCNCALTFSETRI